MFTLKIFCKAPIPGEVKTRLIPDLGVESATALHQQMAQRVINLCLATEITDVADVELWCSPSICHEFYDQFDTNSTRKGVVRHLQVGNDLGQRMANGFNNGVTRNPAILIGTDCANLDIDYLVHAMSQLENHDAVIGPAEDGGYGLIGLRHPCVDVFRNISWGTENVCAQTCDVLNRLEINSQKLNWALLPLLWDVDRIEDVERLNQL
jgi:rSAM/selenodomain-associated transferase 1